VKICKSLSLFVCLSTLILNSALAEPYLGTSVGGNLTTVTKDITYLSTTTNLSDRYYGARLQVLAGYNFRTIFGDDSKTFVQSERAGYTMPSHSGLTTNVGNVFAALEAAFEYNSGAANSSINPWFLNTSASVRETLQYSGDIFALGKYQLTPSVILFLGPGISWGYFKVTTPSVTAGNLGVSGTHHSTLTGWGFRAGTEINIADDMNLVIAYQYTKYDNIRWTSNEPLTLQSVSGTYTPIVNSLSLGINFYNLF
jgi:opacity protein-like surface antigen